MMQLRRFLGRSRMAVNYVLGRQPMHRGATAFDDDVWLVSYPKSGNTWTRFLIANLIAGDRTVDWSNIEQVVPDLYISRDPLLRRLPRPRFIKSHEPYRPEYRRVLLIVRDPRDVAVSYFHFARKSHKVAASASIEEFLPQFLAGRVDPYGSWGENVGSWLGARRGTPEFHVVRYEDLLADTAAGLTTIVRDFGIAADAEQIRRAVENSAADKLRQLEAAQSQRHKFLKRTRADIPFVRKATSGGWQTELPPHAARRIEEAWGPLMRELGYTTA